MDYEQAGGGLHAWVTSGGGLLEVGGWRWEVGMN